MDHEARRARLRKLFAPCGGEALLVTNYKNVTYLTGFSGDDSYLLLHRGGELILSDPRYTTQLKEECPDFDLHIRRPGVAMHEAVAKVLAWAKVRRLAVEADSFTVGMRDRLVEKLPRLELISTRGLVEQLREIKDKEEISRIRHAVQIAEEAFKAVRVGLRLEHTEKQVADELEMRMRQLGARRESFPAIVAVGARAALPHASPTNCRLGEADLLLVDWGANGGLYQSDLTRVLVTGRITAKLERIYKIVWEAQRRAIAAIRPGVEARKIDAIARNYIADAKFGRYFGHGLGHGLGLEVHEAPRLNAESTTMLKAGMVVTVEPGIYLPGWGGVRIEDDVLVTAKGHEVLTNISRRWEDAILFA